MAGGFGGKYVYYGDKDGGFCFGKIEAEGEVNTPDGLRKVFIVVDRMSCVAGGPMQHIRGRTNLRQDKLDLKRDVYERLMGIDALTDEQLFLTMMAGGVDKEVVVDAVGRGVATMLYWKAGEEGLVGECKGELERRMGGRGMS